jgi:hypothetical protein
MIKLPTLSFHKRFYERHRKTALFGLQDERQKRLD